MAKKNKYCGKIKVGMEIYKIQVQGGVVADDGKGLLGQADHSKSLIRISTGYNKYDQYKTLWHEIIHAINAERNLDLEEAKVNQLTNGIVLLLHDNPNLISMILEERFGKNY